MENLDFLSNANVTDVLSSNNDSKWRRMRRFIFTYEKYRGIEHSMKTCVRVRGDELVRSKFTMGDRSVMFCRWQ